MNKKYILSFGFIFIFPVMTTAGDFEAERDDEWENFFLTRVEQTTSDSISENLEQTSNAQETNQTHNDVINNIPLSKGATPILHQLVQEPTNRQSELQQLGWLRCTSGTPNSVELYVKDVNGNMRCNGHFLPLALASFIPSSQCAFSMSNTSTTTTTTTNNSSALLPALIPTHQKKVEPWDDGIATQAGIDLGFTFEMPTPAQCFNWRYSYTKHVETIISDINRLKHPLIHVSKTFPDNIKIFTQLKGGGVVNPLRRMVFLLAVQATQEQRNLVLVKAKSFYATNTNSNEYKLLCYLQRISDQYQGQNPFGLLFEDLNNNRRILQGWQNMVDTCLIECLKLVEKKIKEASATSTASIDGNALVYENYNPQAFQSAYENSVSTTSNNSTVTDAPEEIPKTKKRKNSDDNTSSRSKRPRKR